MLKFNLNLFQECLQTSISLDLISKNLFKKKDLWKYIKNADIREIAEIKIDKTQAGKTVEEIEETDFVSIYLIFRDDLSILPQKDTMLKLNDIIIIRDGN